MELENRNVKETNKFEFNNKCYIDELNEQNLSLRSKKITKILKMKRRNIIEQTNTTNYITDNELQFQIYKFSTSFNIIISYLKSYDDNIQRYILNQLNIYFKYNEPDTKEQKMIVEGQFLELLLNLGIHYFKQKNEENLIHVLWIFINIQIFNEGNGDYLKRLYDEQFLCFYDDCFSKSNSDEIMNEIIILLYYLVKINRDANIQILQRKVFESIINYYLNENLDLSFREDIIKLIIACLNLSNNKEFEQKEINMIHKCLIILKNESLTSNEKMQKLCYEGLYNISKINNEYEFNKKMIEEGIPNLILKIKNKTVIVYSLKVLANILTAFDDDLKNINLKEVIHFYNGIINVYCEDDKLIYIILIGIFNIADSKYINLIKSSWVWNQEIIQKIFTKNKNIQLIFIKIIKYIINLGNYNSLKFIYSTKVLEYLIYLLTNVHLDTKLREKILKLVDNYLNRFNIQQKEDLEYLIILNKFKDWINLFSDINNEDDELLQYIKDKYK